jgi:hypothetical protein
MGKPGGSPVTANESGLSVPNIIRYTGGALDQTTSLIDSASEPSLTGE